MNKKQLANELAKKSGLSKKNAAMALEATLDLIVATVKKKEKVTFTGFGTFEARRLKSTQRINPRTGKRFTVPAKNVPKFRAGKMFKSSMPKS